LRKAGAVINGRSNDIECELLMKLLLLVELLVTCCKYNATYEIPDVFLKGACYLTADELSCAEKYLCDEI
jgi:hypothetical protein